MTEFITFYFYYKYCIIQFLKLIYANVTCFSVSLEDYSYTTQLPQHWLLSCSLKKKKKINYKQGSLAFPEGKKWKSKQWKYLIVVFPFYVIISLLWFLLTAVSRSLKEYFFPVSFGDISHFDFSLGFWYEGKICSVQILCITWTSDFFCIF